MQISMKIKQRCLVCKKKLKKDDLIFIRKDNTVIHEQCLRELKKAPNA